MASDQDQFDDRSFVLYYEQAMSSRAHHDYLSEFVAESHEQLAISERCLQRLAKGPVAMDDVHTCFRALHTIHGGAHFMGFEDIESLADASEQLVSAVREGRTTVTATFCEALQAAVARLRTLVDAVAAGTLAADDDRPLRDRLQSLQPPPDPNDYHPSPAGRPDVATARRLLRPDATSIDQITATLGTLDPADVAGFRSCLDLLDAMSRSQGWTSSASEKVTRMRDLVARLSDPGCRPVAHEALLAQAEALIQSVVSSRLRRSVVPVTLEVAQASGGSGAPTLTSFIAETTQQLNQAEALLLKSPLATAEQLRDIRYRFHTVHSMAVYLGYARVARLAQAIERRLTTDLEDGDLRAAGHQAQALHGISGLRALLDDVRRTGRDAGPWPSAAVASAHRLGLDPDGHGSDGFVRVPVAQLEKLADMVGAMRIAHAMSGPGGPSVGKLCDRLESAIRGLAVNPAPLRKAAGAHAASATPPP